jgi:hypothetical protein
MNSHPGYLAFLRFEDDSIEPRRETRDRWIARRRRAEFRSLESVLAIESSISHLPTAAVLSLSLVG